MNIPMLLLDCMGGVVYGYLFIEARRNNNTEEAIAWTFALSWFLFYLCERGF